MQSRDSDGGTDGNDDGGATRFQATISLPAGAETVMEDLDIDVLPPPPRPEGEEGRVVAIVDLNDVERLVSRGARVTVERVISGVFPRQLIMTEEEARARLEPLTGLRESDEG